jgi:hypothetical protein
MKTRTALFLLLTAYCLLLTTGCKKPAPAPPADPRDAYTGNWAMQDSTEIQFSKATPALGNPDQVEVRAEVSTITKDGNDAGRVNITTTTGATSWQWYAIITQPFGHTVMNIPQQTITASTGGIGTVKGDIYNIFGAPMCGEIGTDGKLKYWYTGTSTLLYNGTTYTIPNYGHAYGSR